MADEKREFEGWAILELMGHRRLAGWVSEATIAGGAFLRIDVPGPRSSLNADGKPDLKVLHVSDPGRDWVVTQFYRPESVYCLTPCMAEAAFAMASANRPRPVQHYELPEPEQRESGGSRYAEYDLARDEDEDETPY